MTNIYIKTSNICTCQYFYGSKYIRFIHKIINPKSCWTTLKFNNDQFLLHQQNITNHNSYVLGFVYFPMRFIKFKFLPAQTQDTNPTQRILCHVLCLFVRCLYWKYRATHVNVILFSLFSLRFLPPPIQTNHPPKSKSNASPPCWLWPYQLQNDTNLWKNVKRMKMIHTQPIDHSILMATGAFRRIAPGP